MMSPSTRRVWIEIDGETKVFENTESPSTRRVWIEIWMRIIPVHFGMSHPPHGGCGLKLMIMVQILKTLSVTLHTEGVD